MALSFPYALDFLAQYLTGPEIPLTLHRFDEMSGGGDGRHWSAQMSTPLWGASYPLFAARAAQARELNAKVYGLDGMQKALLWSDPYYQGPARGNAGLSAVTVASIRSDRGAIGLAGLPGGFSVTPGDYLSINYASGRVYFGTFLEGGTGTGQREIRPYLPLSVNSGAAVELVRPCFKAIVTEFSPFATARGMAGVSASITILQKP